MVLITKFAYNLCASYFFLVEEQNQVSASLQAGASQHVFGGYLNLMFVVVQKHGGTLVCYLLLRTWVQIPARDDFLNKNEKRNV